MITQNEVFDETLHRGQEKDFHFRLVWTCLIFHSFFLFVCVCVGGGDTASFCVNVSAYRAIWTHFRSNLIFFGNVMFQNYIFELQIPGEWMLNTQEGGRLDAKRQYVIWAKALDGIWPVGHACAKALVSAAKREKDWKMQKTRCQETL